ncbi:hypothetical protein AB1Y20_010334 [Prymnesium parvum]|uniref:Uncharacterized protein n=1 Tax=Prymnesium parvum TaxID=97485 RepID=A0AB34K962_PRYPA
MTSPRWLAMLTLDAAEWNSIGRRAPAGYTCKPLDAQREIFSHEARQKVSAGLRTLLSATDGLPAEKARAAMQAACRRRRQRDFDF